MPEGRIRHYNIKEVETKIHPIMWSAMAAKWLYHQYCWAIWMYQQDTSFKVGSV